MSACYCTGVCRITGRCPNAAPWDTHPNDEIRREIRPVKLTPKINEGWRCPVCGKGNAPFAFRCQHC